jgi:hypothetical protein
MVRYAIKHASFVELSFVVAITTWIVAQLVKQKKTDYKPRNDDISFARVNTEPCDIICETLDRVGVVAKQNLSGKNLETFLTEVGVAFHRSACSLETSFCILCLTT